MSTDLPSHTSTSALAPIHRQWDVVLRCYHSLGKRFRGKGKAAACVRGHVLAIPLSPPVSVQSQCLSLRTSS